MNQPSDAPGPFAACIGWVAMALSTMVAMLWAFWGIIENFHEGWFQSTLALRLLGSLFYLCPMLATMALTLIALRWPRLGAVLFIGVGIWFTWWILRPRVGTLTLASVLSWLPVTLFVVVCGILYLVGRPRPLRLAYTLAIALPLLVVVVAGPEPAWRVTHRLDDRYLGARTVHGNGVTLTWAPAGPGWVRSAREATSWEEAKRRCSLLTADGLRLAPVPQHAWRLPTVEEAVRSLTRRGANAGGRWDSVNRRATYRILPDKESPLWDTYAETIYWWTATEAGPDRAYRIVYNGQVHALPKRLRMGTLGFRAVRDVR